MAAKAVPSAVTPQAFKDSSKTQENSAVTIDVLLNDLGGAARLLYSVDQSNPLLSTTSALSTMGAQIKIASGQVAYDPSAALKIQALRAGDTATDTFTYALRLANGTVSTATVSVALTGANDLANISGKATGAVQEDGTMTTAGTLTVTDVDTGEALFGTIGSLTGTYGKFTFDKGNWDYTLANDTVQTLGAAVVVKDTLLVQSKDGSATQTIEVSIAGVNDAAKFSGDLTGSVKEDGTLTTGGKVTVTDIDTGEAAFSTIGDLVGTYGTFTFAGTWGYTLDNIKAQALGGNDVVADTLKIASIDGTEQTISVEIQGANEPVPVTVSLIDFEDLSGALAPIPSNYKGFNWASGPHMLHTLHEDYNAHSGYQTGSISPGQIVAYTPGASKPVNITRPDGGDFMFDKVYLTAAWDASGQATVAGYNNSVLVGSVSVNIGNGEPTLVDVDWGSIDHLRIDSTGQHLVLDNFFMG